MVHDSWLKIRISGCLVDGLRAKYGKGVSEGVRGLIEMDLEKKSDAAAFVGKIAKDKSVSLTPREIQDMVNKLQAKKK